MTILLASFPLAPTINEMYETDLYTGRRHMSTEGKQWLQECWEYLDYGQAPDPYCIRFLNTVAVQEIRLLYATKSRKKAVLERKRWYSLDLLSVFDSERRDNDGSFKIVQDMIAAWIGEQRRGMQANFFNDRRFVEGRMRRVVDPHAPPHIEICMRECDITWESGQLLAVYSHDLTPSEPQPFWTCSTEKTPHIQSPKRGKHATTHALARRKTTQL